MTPTLALFAALVAAEPEVKTLPSARLSLGGAGRSVVAVGPMFSAQLLAGVGVAIPVNGMAVVIWPQIGGGLDTARSFRSGYGIATAGLMVGDLWFAVGYHPGVIFGRNHVRGEPIPGIDPLENTLGFHHRVELRGPYPFWGVEVQHDVYGRPRTEHVFRVMFTLEVPIGLLIALMDDDVSLGGL